MSLEADVLESAQKYPDKQAPKNVEMALTSFPALTAFLSSLSDPVKVANLLRWELQGARRPSYINRIYGRYHRILSKRDYEYLFKIDPGFVPHG